MCLAAGIVADIRARSCAHRGRVRHQCRREDPDPEPASPDPPPAPGRAIRVEHGYRRHGVCAYIAAWDVHRAPLFGNVLGKISIVAFDALAAQGYGYGPRTLSFGQTRLLDRRPAAPSTAASPPSTVSRHSSTISPWCTCPRTRAGSTRSRATSRSCSAKPSRPLHFTSQDEVAERILGFQDHYQQIASPFQWKFTRQHLHPPHGPYVRIPGRPHLTTPHEYTSSNF